MTSKIFCATDGTEHSTHAVELAAAHGSEARRHRFRSAR